MDVLPKVVYRFNVIPSKFQCNSSLKLKKILKSIPNHKRSQIAKIILNNKNTPRVSPHLFEVIPQNHSSKNSMGIGTKTETLINGMELRNHI